MRSHDCRATQGLFCVLNRVVPNLGNHLLQRTVLPLRPLRHRLGRRRRANHRRDTPHRLGRNFRLHSFSIGECRTHHFRFLQLDHRRLQSNSHPSPRRLHRLGPPPCPLPARSLRPECFYGASTHTPRQTRTRLAFLALVTRNRSLKSTCPLSRLPCLDRPFSRGRNISD